MTQKITVTLSANLKQTVDKLSQKEGVPPDEVVGQAVKQLIFLRQFRSLREHRSAKAKCHGIVSDQDIFRGSIK